MVSVSVEQGGIPTKWGALGRVAVCIDDVSSWMKANRLQLNLAKTKVLLCASSRRQHLVLTASVRVSDVLVSPITAVRNLGVYQEVSKCVSKSAK